MKIFRILSAIILTFCITACDGGSGGTDSTPAPDTPENITVTPAKGGLATVAWTGNSNNGTYSLVYNTQNSITEGTPSIETAALSGIEISGLTIGATYYFWIVPVDEDDVEMTPVAAPDNDSGGYMMPEYDDPDTPSDIVVHIYSDGDVFVEWAGNTNDGSYKVYANTTKDLTGTPVSGSDSGYDEIESRYYESLYGLTSGNSYYICVVPVKQDSTELTPVWYDSDTATAGVVDPVYIDLPAEVPTNVAAVIDADGNVLVTWDGNSNDGIYRIYCGSTPDFHSCSEMYQTDVSSPYTISDLATGTWYVFVAPGTSGSTSDGVIANSGSPVQIWVPHMINEIIEGTGVRSLQCDGDYIYYTDYSNNFGMIDIREVTDYSDGSFSPTPVTQNVSSMTVDRFALVGDQAFFSLSTGADKNDPEMARIYITKGTGAPSLSAPSTFDIDTYKTGSDSGHHGKNITTDGTYVYLFVNDKSGTYPDEEFIASFNPATGTWLDYVSAGTLCNNPGMIIVNNTIYASLNKSISIFDITDPDDLGSRVSNTVTDSLGGQIIVSGNYIFTYKNYDTVEIFNKDDYSLASSVNLESYINSMYISGNFLFVTNSSTGTEGMGIIDITDPANPGPVRWVITGTYTYNNYNKMAAGIAVVGNYAFVGTPNGISVVELQE